MRRFFTPLLAATLVLVLLAPASGHAVGRALDESPFAAGYWLWRHVLTRIDGPRCAHYPSCSHYAHQALAERGLVLGTWLAVDRLTKGSMSSPIREMPRLGGRYGFSFFDPVAANIPWLAQAEEPARVEVAADAPASPPAEAPPTDESANGYADALAYARWLLNNQEPALAEGAFLRAAYLARSPAEASLAYLGLGEARLLAGRPLEAARTFLGLATPDDTGAVADPSGGWATLRGGVALLLADRPFGALDATDQLRPNSPTPELQTRLDYLAGWAELERHRFEAARQRFAGLAAAATTPPTLADSSRQLAEALADPVESLPHKSPLLAGVLSLVPGLGHAYLGSWDIALTALIWNSAFIYGTVDTALDGRIGLAALIGVFASLWYTGTIYGAVNGAVRYNRDARSNLLDELRLQVPAPSGSDPDAGGLLALPPDVWGP